MIIIIDCNRFQSHSNPGIQGPCEGGEGTCDLGLGCSFSHHLSLKYELQEVCSTQSLPSSVGPCTPGGNESLTQLSQGQVPGNSGPSHS